MMRKKITILMIVLFAVINLFILISGKSAEKTTPPVKPTLKVESDERLEPIIPTRTESIELPEKLTFAGERVPLEDFDVRERLEKEMLINTYWQSNTLQLMKRANRFFPVIEKILKQNGVPEDFKYLALAESGMENLISPRDARGIWQFLEPTAKQYGLEVSTDVDERYHLEKSTEAAAKYLKEQYEKFGSWALAAAAYNAGRAGVLRQMNNQKVNSYWNLYLNTETARYVFRLIALKEIIENPGRYGYIISESDLYQPFKFETVTVSETIPDIADFAQSKGTTYKHLKILNPWLKTTSLTVPQGKKYKLKILTGQPE